MPGSFIPSALRAAAAAVMVLALAACANGSDIAPAQSALRDPATLGLGTTAGDLRADWWRDFGDNQLDDLIARALGGSPSLKLAQARLARALAGTAGAESATLPQVSASVDATHELFTRNGLYPPPLAGSVRDVATLQAGAGWELDFFGKNQAALDAALGSARAAQADADAARVLLASNLARSWFQWARVHAQLAVAQRTLAQREESLHLVRQRLDAGLDTRLDLRQSDGSLPDARQQIEALAEQELLARHMLAALAGEPVLADSLKAPVLADIRPLALPAALPANLLGLRPDIAAARWRVEAAASDRASARAQFYPNINLVAFAGLSSIGLGRLHEAGSLQWGVGPALRLPLFDGGRLRAGLRGRTAELDAAIESYNAAVVDAVRDAADQSASVQSLARQQAEQRQAQAAAQDAYDIAVQRYGAGIGNYLQVLAAESAVLAQRRLAVDLAGRALDTQVALIRALGGGASAAATPPAPDKTAQK